MEALLLLILVILGITLTAGLRLKDKRYMQNEFRPRAQKTTAFDEKLRQAEERGSERRSDRSGNSEDPPV